ncbi:DoxX family protein [Kineosporia succinea]|uniref:Membrane protein YphA (DoxX/SURF4 family)/vacuolar-type H+-ATPase subunit H n=1 Tax=Kineosporia succinea TaxID=84632 RepID=A0ABT9P415_9ACTN|nr:DoxX family membrane protein [Kineosporia succinea]MDP9827441.1 putative membrane protein YphA (DoxX/SURF4 family)/vacuolar-type H+-ATPase subunit H [Kineosporia succinea]
MTLVRRVARPLLAAPLIQSGVEAARHPGAHAEAARPVLKQVSGPLRLPNDPVMVVRSAGAVTAVAGSLLAAGRLPRLSALAIVVTAPVVQPVEPFWKEKDPALRREKQATFVKTLGLIGGALLATVDTEGKPSVAYRGRKARKAAGLAVREVRADAHDTVAEVKVSGRKATKKARKQAQEFAREAEKAARQAAKEAGRTSRRARKKAEKIAAKQSAKAHRAAQKAGHALPI